MTPPTPEAEPRLNTAQALELAEVSRSTLERWIRDGKLTVYRTPGKPRERLFDPDDIRKLTTPEPATP